MLEIVSRGAGRYGYSELPDQDGNDDTQNGGSDGHSMPAPISLPAPETSPASPTSPFSCLSITDITCATGDGELRAVDEEECELLGETTYYELDTCSQTQTSRRRATATPVSAPDKRAPQPDKGSTATVGEMTQSTPSPRATAGRMPAPAAERGSASSPEMSSGSGISIDGRLNDNGSYSPFSQDTTSPAIHTSTSTSPVADLSFEDRALLVPSGSAATADSIGGAEEKSCQGQDNLTLSRQRRLLASTDTATQATQHDTPHDRDTNNCSIFKTLSTTALIQPRFPNRAVLGRAEPSPSPRHKQKHDADGPPQKPAIIRTTSSRGRLPLRHPVPDLNLRSGAYVGNIAQLEATAERFSMTSSIEDAIREAHMELKRSDSRRSSFLAASVQNLSLEGEPTQAPGFARQTSIVDTNIAARSGGYSPGGFMLSPTQSMSDTRLRSASKTSAGCGGAADNLGVHEDGFSSMSRHGPGKASVRSLESNRNSLPEIVEYEPPLTLTQEALDEADRMMASGEDHDDDDTIRASAHQHIDFDFEPGPDMDLDLTPNADTYARRNVGHDGMPHDYLDYGAGPSAPPMARPTNYAQHQAGGYQPPPHNYEQPIYQQQPPYGQRPHTDADRVNYDQAENAFGDFDGVHCEPDNVDFQEMQSRRAELRQHHERISRLPAPPRPTSYFDQNTGQQMLFYPARVPAMLNLPQKLSKTTKASEANKRRSKVLSAMLLGVPEPRQPRERESKFFLPDPLEGDMGSPLMDTQESSVIEGEPSPSLPALTETPEALSSPDILVTGEPSPSGSQPAPPQQFRRPQRLTDLEKRKSRMSLMDGMPNQLRASAFFDLPSTSPQIELKNGSAVATLDSILDASASAPVSAFTDHAFAGKLGSEVYGAEKKRKKRTAAEKAQLRASMALALEDPKKRGSFLSLMGHTRKSSQHLDGRTALVGSEAGDEHQRLSRVIDGEGLSPGLSEEGDALAPGEDEESSSEEEEDEEVYEGPPTTLLAELQLRKQQQKMRTRPLHKAFPNGMHSTLLELDAVHEVERKARKGKRPTLAWEDPMMNPDTHEDEDDDEVPLGMLFAARAAGHNDISAVAAEMNRPIGLIEKKALEDNEPLSRRRDRLQGRDPGVSMYLAPGLNGANKRQSTLTLTPTIAALQAFGQISPGQRSPGKPPGAGDAAATAEEDEEVEGESLMDRMRRIKAKEEAQLPKARPVSRAFSAELLSQFGDPEEEAREREKEIAKQKEAEAGKENTRPTDEEGETLGQRRRRLQAEKEARDHEMGGSGANNNASSPPLAVNGTALHALTGSDRLSRRLSLANVLGAHPTAADHARVPAADPREAERRRRETEARAVAQDQAVKMAGLRAQMPQTLAGARSGAPVGGYLGGRFNDGAGGVARPAAAGAVEGPGYGPWAAGGQAPQGRFAGYAGFAAPPPVAQHAPLVGVGFNGASMPGPAMAPVPGAAGGMVNYAGFNPTYHPMGMGGMGMGMGMGMHGMGGGMPGMGMQGMNANMNGMPLQMQMQMRMQAQQGGPGQVDMVERWRQGVLP